jgi:hypothetical protein
MNKYRNIVNYKDGFRFASITEALRYGELKLLVAANKISELKLQPKFPIEVNGIKIANYLGDFSYFEDGKLVCEDVKGVETSTFRLKWKLVKALYPKIDFRIISASYKKKRK